MGVGVVVSRVVKKVGNVVVASVMILEQVVVVERKKGQGDGWSAEQKGVVIRERDLSQVLRSPRLCPDHPFPLPTLIMASSATPTAADFTASGPLKRTKIVLLGDQSVGKTSLITRCSTCQTGRSTRRV